MADADVISVAGSELEDKVQDLMSFIRVCNALDEGSEHDWVFVVGRLAHAVDEATQAYRIAVNHHAMPHLRDLAAISKFNGGMGAVAPMGTQEVGGQLVNTRK